MGILFSHLCQTKISKKNLPT